MRKLKMLKTHDGAHEGDVVNFQSDAEAAKLVKDGVAEDFDPEKHDAPGDDGRHGNAERAADRDAAAAAAAEKEAADNKEAPKQ